MSLLDQSFDTLYFIFSMLDKFSLRDLNFCCKRIGKITAMVKHNIFPDGHSKQLLIDGFFMDGLILHNGDFLFTTVRNTIYNKYLYSNDTKTYKILPNNNCHIMKHLYKNLNESDTIIDATNHKLSFTNAVGDLHHDIILRVNKIKNVVVCQNNVVVALTIYNSWQLMICIIKPNEKLRRHTIEDRIQLGGIAFKHKLIYVPKHNEFALLRINQLKIPSVLFYNVDTHRITTKSLQLDVMCHDNFQFFENKNFVCLDKTSSKIKLFVLFNDIYHEASTFGFDIIVFTTTGYKLYAVTIKGYIEIWNIVDNKPYLLNIIGKHTGANVIFSHNDTIATISRDLDKNNMIKIWHGTIEPNYTIYD